VVSQTMAEHRMYLPLAAGIVLAVLALHALAGRRSLAILALLAVALGVGTIRRNQVYQSVESVWADTVARCPFNVRACLSLGRTLADAGRTAEAIAEYEAAIRAQPSFFQAHFNLGLLLAGVPGRRSEAIGHFAAVLQTKPDFEPARTMIERLRAAP